MTDWHTNLIRDYVPSPRRRRTIYVAMVSFFALCGLALVAVAYQATMAMVEAVHEQEKVRLLEQNFRTLYGAEDQELTAFAGQLGAELQQTQHLLERVKAQVRNQLSFNKILAGVRLPLPADVRLIRFSLSPGRGQVTFDLEMPNASVKLAEIHALIETWNGLPALQSQIRDIQIVGRQTQRSRDTSVVVVRLEGHLARGTK